MVLQKKKKFVFLNGKQGNTLFAMRQNITGVLWEVHK